MNLNKCIDLLKQGQPYYHTPTPELSYDAGREMAQTWADMILIDFEHRHFDVSGLAKFMKGLTAGGSTASGHLTPTVVTTLPHNAISVEEVSYNAWQMRHSLETSFPKTSAAEAGKPPLPSFGACSHANTSKLSPVGHSIRTVSCSSA